LTIALPARAKLNPDLEIIRRRQDGYHDLKTTMHEVELHDFLLITKATQTELTISGLPTRHENNSVLTAQKALQQITGQDLNARFHLHKRIPPGSGMGGASSNAAAAMMGVKALFNLDVDLAQIAKDVGADVPFFLRGGTARVEGLGERVTPLPTHQSWFAIAWPGIELSTRAVYGAWDEVHGPDLRRAAEQVEPRLKDFAAMLGEGWQMTGSGSAFFNTSATENEAKVAIRGLDCWTTVTSSVDR